MIPRKRSRLERFVRWAWPERWWTVFLIALPAILGTNYLAEKVTWVGWILIGVGTGHLWGMLLSYATRRLYLRYERKETTHLRSELARITGKIQVEDRHLFIVRSNDDKTN